MAFPAVSLLDNLTRAAEKPLSKSGAWVFIAGTVKTGEISGEAWKATDAFATENGAFWSLEELGGEVGMALEYHGGLTSERYGRIWCCMSSPDLASKSGYVLKVRGEAAAGKVKFLLEKCVEGAFSTLKEKAAVALAAGDRIGISAQSGTVTVWKKAGAGAWEVILEHADASYTSGFVGLSGAGNTHTWRNAEAGGTVVKVKLLTSTAAKQTVKLSKALARTLRISQGQTISLEASISAAPTVLTITQPQSAALSRTVSRTLPLVKAKQTPKVTRTREKTLTVAQPQEPELIAVPADLRLSISVFSLTRLGHSVTKTLPVVTATQVVTLEALVESPKETEERIEREFREEAEKLPHTEASADSFASGVVMS